MIAHKQDPPKPKPQTPAALDETVKRIFSYGLSKRILSERAGSSGPLVESTK